MRRPVTNLQCLDSWDTDLRVLVTGQTWPVPTLPLPHPLRLPLRLLLRRCPLLRLLLLPLLTLLLLPLLIWWSSERHIQGSKQTLRADSERRYKTDFNSAYVGKQSPKVTKAVESVKSIWQKILKYNRNWQVNKGGLWSKKCLLQIVVFDWAHWQNFAAHDLPNQKKNRIRQDLQKWRSLCEHLTRWIHLGPINTLRPTPSQCQYLSKASLPKSRSSVGSGEEDLAPHSARTLSFMVEKP